MAESLDPGWLAVIERNVPYYHHLGLDADTTGGGHSGGDCTTQMAWFLECRPR